MGGGVEFADHREYTAGDDLRYLDWNVYARHDHLLLKRFQEEEDLHVYFLSIARQHGVRQPGEVRLRARQVAAALAYIALADLDRIAVTAFAGDVLADFPLTRGKARILSLLKFLETLPLAGTDTSLVRMARAWCTGHSSGLAIVISDLYDPAGFEAGLDLLRHYQYEPYVVQIFDPSEADPKFLGDIELVDVENGAGQKAPSPSGLRQYKQIFQQFSKSRSMRSHAQHGLRHGVDRGAVRRVDSEDDAQRGRGAMNFANPAALWWALLAVPIVVFYILKIRLRREPVSTIIFWRQIFHEKQPRSIWQHLRHLTSLALQLAFLALLVGGVVKPLLNWQTKNPPAPGASGR